MAKDGTMRGGARPGSGQKKKALEDRILDGTQSQAIIIKGGFPDPDDLDGEDMPPVKDYLLQTQKDGSTLYAKDIFKETWQWLKKKGCTTIVSKQLVEQYAMSVARWIQCEEAVTKYGYLAKHPTTGAPIASPYVAMSRDYKKQMSADWFCIWQIVKENCSTAYGENPHDDMMERLLKAKG